MKNLLLAVCVLGLSLLGNKSFAIEGKWFYGAVVTNPTSSTVLATTGAIPASGSVSSPASANYLVGLYMYCSVTQTYQLEVLNASAVVQSIIPFVCSSTQVNVVPSGEISFPIQDGWTIEVVPASSFTGFGSAQIFYAKQSVN
jgi:hypothetical protein